MNRAALNRQAVIAVAQIGHDPIDRLIGEIDCDLIILPGARVDYHANAARHVLHRRDVGAIVCHRVCRRVRSRDRYRAIRIARRD